jgi:hypothetical protein
VGQDYVVMLGNLGNGGSSGSHILALILSRNRLPPLEECVSAQSDNYD